MCLNRHLQGLRTCVRLGCVLGTMFSYLVLLISRWLLPSPLPLAADAGLTTSSVANDRPDPGMGLEMSRTFPFCDLLRSRRRMQSAIISAKTITAAAPPPTAIPILAPRFRLLPLSSSSWPLSTEPIVQDDSEEGAESVPAPELFVLVTRVVLKSDGAKEDSGVSLLEASHHYTSRFSRTYRSRHSLSGGCNLSRGGLGQPGSTSRIGLLRCNAGGDCNCVNLQVRPSAYASRNRVGFNLLAHCSLV